MKKRWVVVSDGMYLVSLSKALRGEGLEGGAYTSEVKSATRFTFQPAASAARQVYQGVPKKLEE